MARHMFPKIHWKLPRQLARQLSSNKIDPAKPEDETPEDTAETHHDNVGGSVGGSSSGSVGGPARYTVCKGRSNVCQKYIFDRRNVQKKMAGLQDEYDILEPPEEPKPRPPSMTNKPSKGYRQFEASTTYKNVTLPLKSSKLANPFPEPVKLMPSDTVSDQEKAEQMQKNFRMSMNKIKRS